MLAYKLAETEPMKFDDTLADVEGIAYTIRWLKADTVVDTLGYVEPEAPVDTLADIWRGGGRDC